MLGPWCFTTTIDSRSGEKCSVFGEDLDRASIVCPRCGDDFSILSALLQYCSVRQLHPGRKARGSGRQPEQATFP